MLYIPSGSIEKTTINTFFLGYLDGEEKSSKIVTGWMYKTKRRNTMGPPFYLHFLEVLLVHNLVFRWPKPVFSIGLKGAHGSHSQISSRPAKPPVGSPQFWWFIVMESHQNTLNQWIFQVPVKGGRDYITP